jgi:hypothetical protein
MLSVQPAIPRLLSANCRISASHSASVGWKPTKRVEDFLNAFGSDLEKLVQAAA